MSMENPREGACPNCSELLYKPGPIDFGASIFGRDIDLPKIISQERAHFLRCKGCSMFVLMQPAAVPARGLGFEVHPSRKFFEKIPEES
jgi:DNA-directed RNA polymerase subunit RPC12/RpoP